MLVGSIIMTLAAVALVRTALLHRYAAELAGKDVKEEFGRTIEFFRRRPVAGSLVIGTWILQYFLVLALLVALLA